MNLLNRSEAQMLMLVGLLIGNTTTTAVAQQRATDVVVTKSSRFHLPKPYATASAVKFTTLVAWPAGRTPTAPKGFVVTKFAGNLKNPRWTYTAPNGDVFVAESATNIASTDKPKRTGEEEFLDKFYASKAQNFGSANRITVFRDENKDGVYESRHTFLELLNQPFGMLVLNNSFYVANTDGLYLYPYQAEQTQMLAPGKKIMDLPKSGYNNHWTRNIIANQAGTKIYISVGSESNDGEHGPEADVRRANILEINPDGTGERIYASGLRNPNGMDWAPGTQTLWTAVNERDGLGDDLVPDYATSVREGGFYGWPYAYYGPHEDPSLAGKRPDLVQKALVPDVALGPHTASLGLAFYKATAFPAKYRNGLFIGQHGSWNRSAISGYRVVFVPFAKGQPVDQAEVFLSGFVADEQTNKIYGRPVGVSVLPSGSLLVADDAGNTLWQVSAQ